MMNFKKNQNNVVCSMDCKNCPHGASQPNPMDDPMLELVQEIGTKLRMHKKKAGGIAISIRNNELFTKEWQCRISIPTQSPTYLAKTAFSLFAKNYQWEHPIRSVTVRAINLFEEDCPIQYDLFTDMKSLDRQERMDAAIEQMRLKMGCFFRKARCRQSERWIWLCRQE